jgi:hypothetical protein
VSLIAIFGGCCCLGALAYFYVVMRNKRKVKNGLADTAIHPAQQQGNKLSFDVFNAY